MRKNCMLMILLGMASLVACSQDPLNFKIIGDSWIVPQNIQQAIDSVAQEASRADFSGIVPADTVTEDVLKFTLDNKKETKKIYDEWEETIPTILLTRLASHEEDRLDGNDYGRNYFEVYAVANNKGKVLSVYFKVNPRLMDLIKEEELSDLSTAIMEKGINPGDFDFRRQTNEQSKEEISQMQQVPDTSVAARWAAWAAIEQEFKAQRTPCTYGIVCLFGKEFAPDYEANARPFEHFKRVNGTGWIVPLDIEQAIEPLQKEAIEKNFEKTSTWQKGEKETLVGWLDFTISKKSDVNYASAHSEWGKLIPASLIIRLREQENKRLKTSEKPSYFSVYVVADRNGKITAVYFNVNPRLIDLVQESELQSISNGIMQRSIDPAKFDFRYPVVGQQEKIFEQIKQLLPSKETREKRMALMRELENAKTPSTYGIIPLCSIGTPPIPAQDKNQNK